MSWHCEKCDRDIEGDCAVCMRMAPPMKRHPVEDIETWRKVRDAFAAIPAEHQAAALGILEALGKVGPNAVGILSDEAQGLVLGLPYGDWTDGRDLVRAAQEEARDGISYTRRALQLEQARRHFEAAHAALQAAE